ncbi:hypothetical protein [Pseudoxanthomonas sp.]|uniref:hypothetical protein n=1 Tax=Pseudoxanthomonas sp. TaxID=1871049 RepID=UPI0025892DD9|nr:hypothetical protein [Pseudoxanthomonas sp.]MCR6686076.1 hypothetical protein [Pseudoxanthomonas sp.]
MELTALTSAYTALQFIRDSMSLAVNSKIDEEARAKIQAAMDQVAGLHDMLFHTQQQLLGLQQENADLKRQVTAAQSWEQRAAQYSLVRSPGRALVYSFSGQPEHYACPNCFETNRISILQDRGVMAGTWDCPACSKSFNVTPVSR